MAFTYIANQLRVSASLVAQASTAAAGAINGTAVDISALEGPLLVVVNAALASASDTITFTVEHSTASGSGFAAVDASILVNPDTGDADTFEVVTDALNSGVQTLALRRELLKRYVRIVATTAGSGISVVFSGEIAGLLKRV